MGIPFMSIVWGTALAKCLAELALVLAIPSHPDWSNVRVTGVCEDTRRLVPGDLFVAIPGHRRDGCEFVDDAIEHGAVAVLAEHAFSASVPVLVTSSARTALAQLAAAFYDHPTSELFTVGVTGTNGKTTVCHWIADILGRSHSSVLSTVRTPVLGFAGLTTPPSPVIQSLARDAVVAKMRHLIVEASSAGIEQDRVGSIDFDACVFTNLSLEHVRHHGGLAAYRKAKLKLFETLKPEAWAIVNADDPMAETIVAGTNAQILRYGCEGNVDARASDIVLGKRNSQFSVSLRGHRTMSVRLPVPGRHNISNALAALSVGEIVGIAPSTMLDRLTHVLPIPGRSIFFRRVDGLSAVVDFAHNGASLEALLSTLRPNWARIIVVFGCPGDGETEKRVSMGRASARWADRIILTADNPKRERAAAIAEEIQTGIGNARIPVCIVQDRMQAIDIAIEQAEAGDLIVLAGKGHEDEQLVNEERLPHSDSDALQARGFAPDDGAAER